MALGISMMMTDLRGRKTPQKSLRHAPETTSPFHPLCRHLNVRVRFLKIAGTQ